MYLNLHTLSLFCATPKKKNWSSFVSILLSFLNSILYLVALAGQPTHLQTHFTFVRKFMQVCLIFPVLFNSQLPSWYKRKVMKTGLCLISTILLLVCDIFISFVSIFTCIIFLHLLPLFFCCCFYRTERAY